jgi:MFS transporter, DHA2 family, methylenomycin A resistance protein
MNDTLLRKPFAMRASHRLTLLTLCLAVMIAHIDAFVVDLGARRAWVVTRQGLQQARI